MRCGRAFGQSRAEPSQPNALNLECCGVKPLLSAEEKAERLRQFFRDPQRQVYWPQLRHSYVDFWPVPNPEPFQYFPRERPAVSLASFLATRVPSRKT